MSKFTPGPWFADAEGQIWRRDPKELYQYGGTVAGDKPLATAYKGWYLKGEIGYPVNANAALIADAPALLEALEIVLKRYDFLVDYLEGHPHQQCEEARGLIAKHRDGV